MSLNGVVKPADSVAFPNIPNCTFYQWSEQMYLWLTSPAPAAYGGGGRIFNSPAFFDVSPLDASNERTFIPHEVNKFRQFAVRDTKVGLHRLPVIFDKAGRMLEIERPRIAPSGKQLILNEAGRQVEVERVTLGPNRKPIFWDKTGRVIPGARPIIRRELLEGHGVQKFMVDRIPIFIDASGKVVDVEQGQADGAVLQAQNGSLVYYGLAVNDVFAYFATGLKNGAIPSPGGNPNNATFPTTQTELDAIIAFAAAHGRTFPDPKALAIEVKTSWVEASTLSNADSHITMTATIPTYDKSDPNKWTPNGQQTVKLALVGIHVVGSTKGHPEMIWATFEHFSSTPNATYSYNSTTGPKTVAQNTAGSWLFSASNSGGPFNVAHMQASGADIVAVAPFTISPSDTIRRKPWGAASTNAFSNTEVISINNSVLGMLANGDVRGNYVMTGATWTIGGAPPGPGNEVGTNKLANTTLETYGQGSDSTAATGSNCFSCHGTNTTKVSHIFGPLKPLF